MDTLPTEIISHIISFLDIRCQLQLSAVSVRWRAAVSDCLRRRKRLDYRDLERRFWTDSVLRVLLPRLPALRVLDTCRDDIDIDIVSENCPLLEKLNLSQFRLDMDSLERLCRRCPRLSDLTLSFLSRPAMFELLLRRLPSVRVLNVGLTDITETIVSLLPAGLEELYLFAPQLHSHERQPADRWPRLTHLRLAKTDRRWSRGMAALVRGCPRLQSLSLEFSGADDQLLELLHDLPLHYLDLSVCQDVTEDGLVRCLGRLRQLRTLNIRDVPAITDRVLDSLAGAEALTFVRLSECFIRPSDQFSMDSLQRLVVSCPSLRTVALYLANNIGEQLESLIVGLSNQLARDREVILVIDQGMMNEVNKSVLPSESRPLRVMTWQCRPPVLGPVIGNTTGS